jgi:SAM-dependent methyltransferase
MTDFDAELARYDAVLHRARQVQPHDRVLDVGCGAGRTTRTAARMAPAGSALGVDVSAAAVERAREIARSEGPSNVAFACADAQTHSFGEGTFDLVISRFGTMFFENPAAAFANLGRALRPGGRLVMLVWQAAERNEWDVALREALGNVETSGPDPFSLADPAVTERILRDAGFTDVHHDDVREPVYYGPDTAAALDWVRGFSYLKGLDSAGERLEQVVAARCGADGVWFGSAAWIVSGRRG